MYKIFSLNGPNIPLNIRFKRLLHVKNLLFISVALIHTLMVLIFFYGQNPIIRPIVENYLNNLTARPIIL